MMIVAAIEHHARWIGRSVLRALAEKCSGYSDSEAGDYLGQSDDETTCYFCGEVTTNVVNTDCDGDTEFVCERCNDAELGPFNRYTLEECFLHARRPYSGACATFVDPKTSVVPPAAEQGPEAVSAAPSPAPASGSPTVPAGSDAPEAASPAGIPWVDWATPAICEVLAEHWWYASRDGEAGCICSYRDGVDMTHEQQREHVAPLIAERLRSAAFLMTGRDFAAETFPQHRNTK